MSPSRAGYEFWFQLLSVSHVHPWPVYVFSGYSSSVAAEHEIGDLSIT
jgi:hypothetical protein